MENVYGEGEYYHKGRLYKGDIVLSEHKVFVRSDRGDLADTFIPLEKIDLIRLSTKEVLIQARPNSSMIFQATIKGDKTQLKNLALNIVNRRGLKKKFLRNEWIEVSH